MDVVQDIVTNAPGGRIHRFRPPNRPIKMQMGTE